MPVVKLLSPLALVIGCVCDGVGSVCAPDCVPGLWSAHPSQICCQLSLGRLFWNPSLPLRRSTVSTAPSDHMCMRSQWISVTGASVCACALLMGCDMGLCSCCTRSSSRRRFMLLIFPQLKWSVRPNEQKKNTPSLSPLVVSSTADLCVWVLWVLCVLFAPIKWIWIEFNLWFWQNYKKSTAASFPGHSVPITHNKPQTSLSTVFIESISLVEQFRWKLREQGGLCIDQSKQDM